MVNHIQCGGVVWRSFLHPCCLHTSHCAIWLCLVRVQLLSESYYRIHFNFCGVKLSRISSHAFVSSWENLDQSETSLRCKTIASQKCKNGGHSLGQLAIQVRASTEAIDYINTTKIQRKRRIKGKDTASAKIKTRKLLKSARKFNSAKANAYSYGIL